MSCGKGHAVSSTCSTTCSYFVEASHTWKIHDFKRLMEFSKAAKQQFLMSDEFSVIIPNKEGDYGEVVFVIKLDLCNMGANEERQSVGLFLTQLESEELATTVRFSFKIKLPGSGGDFKPWTSAIQLMHGNQGWGTRPYAKKQEIVEQALDKDGTLTIVCGLEVFIGHPTATLQDTLSVLDGPSLGEQLMTSVDNLKDIKIIAGEEEHEPRSKKKKKSLETDGEENVI